MLLSHFIVIMKWLKLITYKKSEQDQIALN